MKTIYTMLFLIGIGQIFAAEVNESTCTKIFEENFSKLSNTTNIARALLLSVNDSFSNIKDYENCPEILKNGPNFYTNIIRAEYMLVDDIQKGRGIPPTDLDNFLSQFPSHNSEINSIVQTNRKLAQSQKERCEPINQNDKMPPIRDQTDVGWCYAHAAADVISFHVGKNASAVDVALQFNQYRNKVWKKKGKEAIDLTVKENCDPNTERCFNEGGSGSFAVAIALANKEGVCQESALPSQAQNSRDYGEILLNLKELDGFISTAKGREEAGTLAAEICSKDLGRFIAEAFPLTLVEDVAEVLRQDEVKNGFAELAKRSCRKNRIRTSGEVKYATTKNEGAKKTIDLIHEQLDGENIVGIGYRASVFADIATGVTASDHESTVIGRRWNEHTNSCQFLIRNTLGPTCEKVLDHLDCDNGNFWLDEGDLMTNIGQVYYIE